MKVLDFGISKIAETVTTTKPGLTSTATVMGTPCFMSPEQLRSTRDVDARADIWSLGAILHALMTGTPPYDGESNADVSAKIIRDLPTPLRHLRAEVPAELEAIVLRCLEKDPTRRFPDVASLAEALSQVTPRASSKASATRVARIAAAVAPTVLSVPPPAYTPPGAVGGATPGPTKTASAWGDTRPEEKRGRRIAGMVAVAGIVIGAVVFGVLRWHGGSGASSSAGSATAAGSSLVVPATTTVPATPSATQAPSVLSQAPVASTPPSASAAVTVPAIRSGAGRPPASKAVATATAPATTAAPTATTHPRNGAGLFDGRE